MTSRPTARVPSGGARSVVGHVDGVAHRGEPRGRAGGARPVSDPRAADRRHRRHRRPHRRAVPRAHRQPDAPPPTCARVRPQQRPAGPAANGPDAVGCRRAPPRTSRTVAVERVRARRISAKPSRSARGEMEFCVRSLGFAVREIGTSARPSAFASREVDVSARPSRASAGAGDRDCAGERSGTGQASTPRVNSCTPRGSPGNLRMPHAECRDRPRDERSGVVALEIPLRTMKSRDVRVSPTENYAERRMRSPREPRQFHPREHRVRT